MISRAARQLDQISRNGEAGAREVDERLERSKMAYSYRYPEDLGLDIKELVARGGSAISAAAKVAQDPALPEVTCHVLRLNKITEGRPLGDPCPRRVYTSADRRRGVGLTRVVAPLRAAVWARENPTAAIAVGVGVAGSLVALGYVLGRRR